MMRVTHKRKVVVVGGGITGLTTAYYLQQQIQHAQLPIEVILVESSFRLGGKIQTLRKDGFIIERGPESFFDSANFVRQLAEDLQIDDRIIYNNHGTSYVAVASKLYPIPTNLFYGQPPTLSSLLGSGMVSIVGKLRAAADLILPKSKGIGDESIADFFERRFGKEVVENLVEPLLAGTFAGDIDYLSIKSMFPQFYRLEKQYRSLVLGMTLSKVNPFSPHLNDGGGVMRHGTFKGGLETLVEALEEQLNRTTILKGVKVVRIEEDDGHKMRLHFNNAPSLLADAVIMTTPASVSQQVFKAHTALQKLPTLTSATIGTVNMVFNEEQIEKYKYALNMFVSRNSNFTITSCTWSNNKWDGVAEPGKTLLRIYIGRVGDEAIVELSDSEIEKIVLADLEKAIGLKGKPLMTVVTRWKQAMPQYTVGHEERLQEMRQAIQHVFPMAYIVGSSYEGISLPSCIAQGKQAAEQMLKKLIRCESI